MDPLVRRSWSVKSKAPGPDGPGALVHLWCVLSAASTCLRGVLAAVRRCRTQRPCVPPSTDHSVRRFQPGRAAAQAVDPLSRRCTRLCVGRCRHDEPRRRPCCCRGCMNGAVDQVASAGVGGERSSCSPGEFLYAGTAISYVLASELHAACALWPVTPVRAKMTVAARMPRTTMTIEQFDEGEARLQLDSPTSTRALHSRICLIMCGFTAFPFGQPEAVRCGYSPSPIRRD